MSFDWTTLIAIALATLASEDLTCITSGLLIRRSQLDWFIGTFGCLAGIYLGDLGLWVAGRVIGRPVMRWSWLARKLPQQHLAALAAWYDRHAGSAILASRFLPGTRLPLYVAAGMLGRKGGQFALWSFVACLLWTPLIVWLVALLGDSVTHPLKAWLGAGWLSLVVAIVFTFALLRFADRLLARLSRERFTVAMSRLWRWEFWPMWLFYGPVLPWVAVLSVRYRGFSTITAANPGIPHGGFVGESKFRILSKLAGPWVVPTHLIEPGDLTFRVCQLRQAMKERNWRFPLILKPDVGQRGAGVRLVRSLEEATDYLASFAPALLAQAYHPGPSEAGIFYYRFPGEPAGHIFSITDKRFSALIGDGRSSVEKLIWQHPRYCMQARTFLARHDAQRNRVLASGEGFALAIAGNHCQGTMFCDGSHLITSELERTIDSIARRFDGFYFGRFDVRYSDVEQFMAGQDLAIIELNGIMSESTNIYDPSRSLWWAYRTLCRQWAILFRIGALNRARGHEVSSCLQLLEAIREYSRTPSAHRVSD